MISKAKVLRNAKEIYYSISMDLYFVIKEVHYSYRETKCKRARYYTLGKGQHRKGNQIVQKISKEKYLRALQMAKMYDSKKRIDLSKQEDEI
jgi:hypothetical protein